MVRMGHEARENSDEDDLCAELLRLALVGRADAGRSAFANGCARRRARRSSSTRPATGRRSADFDLCTRVDEFDFVLQLRHTARIRHACVRSTS